MLVSVKFWTLLAARMAGVVRARGRGGPARTAGGRSGRQHRVVGERRRRPEENLLMWCEAHGTPEGRWRMNCASASFGRRSIDAHKLIISLTPCKSVRSAFCGDVVARRQARDETVGSLGGV